MKDCKLNDFKVWHIPQVGMKNIFEVEVETKEIGLQILKILADYDLFQYQNKIKPDYASMQGLLCWNEEEQEWEEIETEE